MMAGSAHIPQWSLDHQDRRLLRFAAAIVEFFERDRCCRKPGSRVGS
jgi:hypothetical protein